MLKVTRRGWQVAFLSPDVLEMERDFVMSGKADAYGISKPDWLPQYAVEEFLYHHGYAEQVVEVRKRRSERKPGVPAPLTLDHLDETQRDVVVLLMRERQFKQDEAIKWVLSHPREMRDPFERAPTR